MMGSAMRGSPDDDTFSARSSGSIVGLASVGNEESHPFVNSSPSCPTTCARERRKTSSGAPVRSRNQQKVLVEFHRRAHLPIVLASGSSKSPSRSPGGAAGRSASRPTQAATLLAELGSVEIQASILSTSFPESAIVRPLSLAERTDLQPATVLETTHKRRRFFTFVVMVVKRLALLL